MFITKRKYETLLHKVEYLVDKVSKITHCEEKGCGALFYESAMQKVEETQNGFLHFSTTRINYYCKSHKKPYDKVYNQKYYISELEVDSNGKKVTK